MSMDFVEELFGSVSTIVSQKINDINYDTTIVATIVDDSDRLNGHYIVTDGTIKFDAYSDISTYFNEDQVRIAILNNDWTKKKFITGKYTDQIDTTAVAYLAPLDTTFTASYLALFKQEKEEEEEKRTIKLKANESGALNRIFKIDLSAEENEVHSNLINSIYDVLTISAKVRTSGLENATNGNYGLKVDIATYGQKGKDEIIHSYDIFDSSEMIGNPYNFIVDSYQSKSIDLSTLGTIKEIILTAYESSIFAISDKGELYVEDNPFEFSGGSDSPTIIFSDITLGYGKNLKNIEDNTLQLYTGNSEFYTYNEGEKDQSIHEKNLSLNWYNKDENGKFIGFSDGIADSNYDEIKYLAEAHKITRLTSQMGSVSVASDEQSLRLSANINESAPLMEQACELLTTRVSQQLQGLWSHIKNESDLADELKELIYWDNDTKPILVTYSDNAKSHMDTIKKHYTDILQYGYYVQNFQNSEPPEWDFDETLVTQFKDQFTTAKGEINTFFNSYNEKIKENPIYNIYENIINDYQDKVETEWGKVESLLKQLTISDSDLTELKGYENKDLYVEYEPVDIEKDNEFRYCTYLYRYNDEYELKYEDNNDEYKFGRFLTDPHWERLGVVNFGLPEIEDDDEKYYPVVPDDNKYFITLEPRAEIEKFKAILFYNHVMYESNELIFKNKDNVPSDVAVNDNDLLLISHGNNSRSHYQSYSSAYDLLNISDASTRREISCSYVGMEMGNEALIGAKIFWYVPKNSTLIAYDAEYLKDQGFSTDEEVKVDRSKENYILFSKTIKSKDEKNTDEVNENDLKFYYQIKPYFEQNTQNNTILVEAELYKHEDIPAHGELPLTFSTFGNNGTKYTLAVSPANINQLAVLPTGDDLLSLKAVLYDANGNKVSNNISFSWYDDCKDSLSSSNNIVTIPNIEEENFIKWDRILEAKATIDDIHLSALYSVPYSTSIDYYISGPSMIVYNNLGTIARVSEEPYCLYEHKLDGDEKVENQKWEILHYPESLPLGYFPSLNVDNTIKPAPMYYTDIEKESSVFATCTVDDEIKWIQPIIIIQNRYESSLLNDWDGSTVIDENNNTIMSAMVGAGRKENDNSFSGVLMGDIVKADLHDKECGVGLYGFDHGAQSFRFGVDGKASLGVAGRGRIEFDGNHGLIKSSVWNGSISKEGKLTPGSAGMAISLEDGHIDAHDFKLTSENVNFNSGYSVTDDNPYYMDIHSSALRRKVLENEVLEEDQIYWINTGANNFIEYDPAVPYDGDLYTTIYYGLVLNDDNFEGFDEDKKESYYYKDHEGKYINYDITLFEGKYPPEANLYMVDYTSSRYAFVGKDQFEKNKKYYRIEGNVYKLIEESLEEYPSDGNLFEKEDYYQKLQRPENNILNPISGCDYFVWDGNKYVIYVSYNKEVQSEWPYYTEKDGIIYYPPEMLIYQKVNKDDGCYYIKFDKYGNLLLSISGATILADKGVTFDQYFKSVDETFKDIEDNQIGKPPECKDIPIYNYFKDRIVYIEDEKIGNPIASKPGSVYAYVNAQDYITHEGIFNKLTDNGKQQGLFKDPDTGNVYINATYIATGILRSKNWQGTLIYNNGSEYDSFEKAIEAVNKGEASWDEGTWTLNAEAGTYWNLNDGQLWANKFELNAWKNLEDKAGTNASAGGLYLNSNPNEDGYYFSIGETPNHFIQYKKDGSLIIKMVNNFILDAFTVNNQGIYLNSNPIESIKGLNNEKKQYWFILGNVNNFIQMDSEGNLTFQTNNKFTVNAWNNDDQKGLFIDSKADNLDNRYFIIGQSQNQCIELTKTQLLIKATDFILDAYTANNKGIYLNSSPIPSPTEDSYFKIGDDNHFIQFTNEYELKMNIKNFVLDAFNGEDKSGIYLNNNPKSGIAGIDESLNTYWFILGSANNFIQMDTKGNLTFQTNGNFTVNAWNSGGLYLNSTPNDQKPEYFKAGSSNSFVQFDKNGILQLQGRFTIGEESTVLGYIGHGIGSKTIETKNEGTKIVNTHGIIIVGPTEVAEDSVKDDAESFDGRNYIIVTDAGIRFSSSTGSSVYLANNNFIIQSRFVENNDENNPVTTTNHFLVGVNGKDKFILSTTTPDTFKVKIIGDLYVEGNIYHNDVKIF